AHLGSKETPLPERRPPLDSVAFDDGPALTRRSFLSATGLGLTAFLGWSGAAKAMSGALASTTAARVGAPTPPAIRSESGLQPPEIAVGTKPQTMNEGFLFLAPFGGSSSGPMIVDDTGGPV